MSAMLMISSSAMVLLRYITKLLPHIISYGFFPSFVWELYSLLLFFASTAIRSWDSLGFSIRSFFIFEKNLPATNLNTLKIGPKGLKREVQALNHDFP